MAFASPLTLASSLPRMGLWLGFWFVCNAVCFWFVGRSVTRGPERGRLALRAVSVVHAVIATVELVQTVSLAPVIWPPTIYGTHDPSSVAWYELTVGYYVWDFLTAIYFQYGAAFVLHGLLSFPVFFFAAVGPRQFLHGFYGRFYHGVFSLSTPWLHVRELMIAAGREDHPFKPFCEYLFALTFIVVRIVLGTWISVRFVLSMVHLMVFEPEAVHSVLAVGLSTLSCTIITCLQMYWFFKEIIPGIVNVLIKKKPADKQQ